MNYVTGVVVQFTTKDTQIDSEEFKNKEGKQVRVPTMGIVLAKI